MSGDAAIPLLRSPPFPRVPAAVAAISRPPAPGAPSPLLPPPPELIARIAEARVGGAFWAPPAADRRAILLRPRTRRDVEAMMADALVAGARPRDLLAVIGRSADRSIASRTAAAGVHVVTGPVDPWSLLAPGVRLLAAEDDEWTLIARLAGADGAAASDARLENALTEVAYRDCFSGMAIDLAGAIEILAGWRRVFDRTRRVSVAVGMAWWKRDAIGRLLWAGRDTPLRFVDRPDAAIDAARTTGGAIAAWPSRVPAELGAQAAQDGVPLVQVEDGFVRSIGLGANLHPPQSIVLDGRGIYYDPTRASDLEHLLEHAPFPPDLVARGEALARFIVARGISKYARGGGVARPPFRDGRRLVLVTGQVEDDLSVRRAGGAVGGNLDLLRRVRAAEPNARILFKPHPDVDAGHRVGRIEDKEALQFVDEVVRDPIDALLAQVDAVHVLTSLTGFEALLRGREVVVHGSPFYVGWGLTTDLAPPIARRTRRLSLAELVAGTLILYPLYLDPVTRLPCPPEVLLERFASGTLPKPGFLIRARAFQGRIANRFGRVTS